MWEAVAIYLAGVGTGFVGACILMWLLTKSYSLGVRDIKRKLELR